MRHGRAPPPSSSSGLHLTARSSGRGPRPLRYRPTCRWRPNPSTMLTTEARRRVRGSKPTHKKSDLSLCATLLSLFDFTASGSVSRLDWERGLSTLLLGGLMDDHDLWARLLEMYDPQGKGAVQLERVRDVLPIDPRISVLLQQLVHSVAGCREYVAGATKKAAKESELKQQRAVINLRKRMLAPIFGGWREVIQSERKLRTRAARHLKSQGLGAAFRSWIALVEANAETAKSRERMVRMLKRLQNQGITKALNCWLELVEARGDAAHRKARAQRRLDESLESVGGRHRGAAAALGDHQPRPQRRAHARLQYVG